MDESTTDTRNVLIQYAHPYPVKSRVNAKLVEAVSGLDNVVVNELYQHYPELHINVTREQALLQDCDLLVFLHPMYWYSAPAIIKEWQDSVLEFGFAYGSTGTALHNKDFMTVTTTGGSDDSYRDNGINNFPVDDLLMPFRQTAMFCGMRWIAPYVVHGTNNITDTRISQAAAGLRERISRYQLTGE